MPNPSPTRATPLPTPRHCPLLRAAALILALGVGVACSVEAVPDAEAPTAPAASEARPPIPVEIFFALVQNDPLLAKEALDLITSDWRDGYAPMLLEVSRFSRHRSAIFEALERGTKTSFGTDHDAAFRWVWSREITPHPDYGVFKARLYEYLDPDFAAYFDDHTEDARIRLDEVRWGGVARDGIPPLDRPRMIPAAEADYLAPDNVVFGIALGGEARAYPKRILAWHEMFKDTIGGTSVAGVYCTLCGSMIVYETEFEGTHHELGTSGFLYRSNKLMYDHATESLWSTLRGEPAIGPLVGKGIRLTPRHVVTTTWERWQALHPETTVLSLDTGHERDYGEGVAYRSYFATDELMFEVPSLDRRLANKSEVLALRFGAGASPTAIAVEKLAATPTLEGTENGVPYVIFTDTSGASRVYARGEHQFRSFDGDRTAVDNVGGSWRLTEDALVRNTPDAAARLDRLPAHRAFWFGWYAAYPNTRLLQ
ncbi:MAG: DUF3179 domain-containing protein [Myxococcota bacterium]